MAALETDAQSEDKTYLKRSLQRIINEIERAEATKSYDVVWALKKYVDDVQSLAKSIYQSNDILYKLPDLSLEGQSSAASKKNLINMKMHVYAIVDSIGLDIQPKPGEQQPKPGE
jgi:hypothetical protein